MLHHLTWTQFFLTAGTCLLLYYIVVILLLYRDELKVLREKTRNHILPQVYLTSRVPETTPTSTLPDTIMGAVSTQDAPILCEASAIQVAPRKEDGDETDEDATAGTAAPAIAHQPFPMGTLADFLQEVKSLLGLVAETQMEKEEFLSLLQLIFSRYSHDAQNRHRDQVQRFLLEQSNDRLPFALTPEDLQALWPKA